MTPSPLPKALWLLPASLLAAVIAGACFGHPDSERDPAPPAMEQPLPTAATPSH